MVGREDPVRAARTRRGWWLAGRLAAALSMVACSEETISIYAHDASAIDAAGDGATGDAAGDAADAACVLPPGRTCEPNGGTCAAAADCCSGRCEGGVCLEPGACAGPGVVCTSRASCCSGRCEPTPNATTRTCLDYCRPDGAACARALDCCSLACNAGTCGGAKCGRRGDACATDAECCGGVCSTADQKCALAPIANCRATGEDCTSGGGPGCCATCDAQNGRCDFGPGACRSNGAPCTQDTDCCRGTCGPANNGVRSCTAACLVDGVACASAADCCGAHCGGVPAVCGSAAVTCKHAGSACATGAECCSTQCLGSKCADACASP